MAILKASDYPNRQRLDQAVEKLKAKKEHGHSIMGTTVQLKALRLSHRSMVYGVPCVATDYVASKGFPRPDRGVVYPFGINGNLTKPPKVKMVKKKSAKKVTKKKK